MRLDLFLKVSGLVRKRSLAREACSAGFVLVNGVRAKPGKQVGEHDVLTLEWEASPDRVRRTVRILRIPEGQVSRRERPGLYEVIVDDEEEGRDDLVQERPQELL